MICAKCGKTLKNKNLKCNNCGQRIEMHSQKYFNENDKPKSRFVIITSCCVILVLAIAILTTILILK